jgi:TonB family protein
VRIFLLLTVLTFVGTQQVPGGAVSSNQLQVISPSSQYDVLPKFISGSPPSYPLSQLQRGESGYAIVEFTIDETGKTRDWRVIKTTYSYYGSHAILALQQWRFQPALKHGRPVSCRARMQFVYMYRGR